MLKNIAIQYLLGLGLSLLTVLIIEGILVVFPDISWHFLTVIYTTIFALQITFYYLTTNYKFGWTALSFIFNFILWTLEQVIIESTFQQFFIYKGENWKVGIFILGGLLWVTNKVLIDLLFKLNKSVSKSSERKIN